MTPSFFSKSFEQLSTVELYDLLRLRQAVFVVEQTCPYLDADGKDLVSHHVMGRDTSGKLIAYARIVPVGVSYEAYASIGRVISDQSYRGKGLGTALMEYTLSETRKFHHGKDIKISAQSHLVGFYGKLGFEAVGVIYQEDDIPHQAMILKGL